MQASKRTAIIGDIGGTHARFAICDIDELSVSHFAVFQTAMFSSLPDAVANYLQSIPDNPDIAGFAIADPVTGDRMGVENSTWSFTAEEVKAACGADRVHFVNNFEALAHCLPYLNAHDRCQINPGEPVDGAPKIVLGAGGEFGSAMLIEASGKRISIAGKAGHAAFAATNERELAILSKVAVNFGYAPIQSILSGRGIEALHAALAEVEGMPEPKLEARDIIDLAISDEDQLARDTLDCFVSILARTAGDVALQNDARGGVYIGRGITPKILKLLDNDRFRETWRNKGAMSAHLASIPVYAILANDAGLRGAAVATSDAFPM